MMKLISLIMYYAPIGLCAYFAYLVSVFDYLNCSVPTPAPWPFYYDNTITCFSWPLPCMHFLRDFISCNEKILE